MSIVSSNCASGAGSNINTNTGDVDEMEAHKLEITEQRILKLGFLGAKLGPEGHQWSA